MNHEVRCNGLTVHYEDHGDGPPVVLVHGGLVTGHLMWSSHVPALARDHRVLVPDSRGHGRTDNPDDTLGYDLMADDCAAFIDALGLDRPVVVGYSDGAQIALELGMRHPDRVAGLVLGGVVVEPDEQYRDALAQMGMTEPGTVDVEQFDRTIPGFLDVIKDLHRHVYGPQYWRRFLDQTSRLWLTLPTYSDEALAAIPVPTLVLAGDCDTAAMAQSPRLCRALPRSELAVIPGADHGAVERPLFADIVLDFTARHTKPEPHPTTGYLTDGGLAGEFEGREHGGSVSLIMVSSDEVGAGPRLHRHPYDETFVIRRGAAEFTVGDQVRIGRAGEVLVVPATVPHKFAKIGTDRLEMIDVHANDVIVTEWLEG